MNIFDEMSLFNNDKVEQLKLHNYCCVTIHLLLYNPLPSGA